jgi:thiol reductant ABC exporter CydC subunit
MTSTTGHPVRADEMAGPQAPVLTTLALTLTRPVAGRLALATLLGAGALGAGIGLIATSAWLISRASQRPPESALAIAIVAVQFFALSRGLFRYEQRLIGHDSAFRSLAALRTRSYERLEALAPAGLVAFRSGDLLARVVHDIDSLQDVLLRVIPAFAIALIVGAGTVALVWWILPAAGLILLAALILTATALTWLTGRLARRSEAERAAARGELTVAVVDLLHGAPELTAYGAVGAQRRRIVASEARLVRVVSSAARTAGVGQGIAILLSGLAMWGGLLVGVAAVRGGVLDGVLLAVIALVPLAAFELGADLPAAAQTLQRVRRSTARTIEVLEAVPPVADPEHPRRVGGLATSHVLRVRGLQARYGTDTPWVLDGLDLDLVSGRSVAVVGSSGAGKSTLANVLLRFLPYDGGSVTLDGIPVSELAGDDYRRVVGLVSQDAYVFDTTLEENLRLARRDATRAQLLDALDRARLLEWITGLPAGLDTRVGAHGAQISGGQRQRLAFARALLADFPVLVVDEPGEHLDIPTADALVADLLDARAPQATLLITHRLAGLPAVDEVIVLDRGRALERGTHAELITLDGAYARMWARETGSASPP